jgi:G:T-mismatch repair DNA endonuclease (very short patch repair protein)
MKLNIDIIQEIVALFRSGVNLSELVKRYEQHKISKFRIRCILRKAIDNEEYEFLINQILRQKRSPETRQKMSVAATIRNANPEWAKKVIATKTERGYFEYWSAHMIEWAINNHPTRGKKMSAQVCANVSAARQRFYDEGGEAGMKGKHHSDETKELLRNITKKMWEDGVYNNTPDYWRSKLEVTVFDDIVKYYPTAQHSFKIKANNRTYMYDIFIPELNLFIEVNGEYWHCNPKTYDAQFFHPIVKRTAQEIWNNDTCKNKVAEDNGYKVIVLWECDYLERGISVVLDALNSRDVRS